jgi:uncharacterized protein (DUF1810 family)
MSDTDDPYDLDRFVHAQAGSYENALAWTRARLRLFDVPSGRA